MVLNKVYIVGDRFTRFVENDNVISISQLEKNVFNGTSGRDDVYYALGQGVSSQRANKLLKTVKLNELYKTKVNFSEVDKSCRHLVHKNKSANSMISTPIKRSETEYEANVIIDDQCDDISDHLTGQHIPGMAIIEASRQMFLAVTELFFLKQYQTESYFVINKSSVEYLNFIFPLDIKIKYRIENVNKSKTGSYRFTVSMVVIQNDKVCVEIGYKFATYESSFLNLKEAAAAKNAINIARSEVTTYE